MKARNGLRPVPPKISVDAWVGDAVVKAVNDVVLRNVRDGGANVEEATCVGPQELVTFLFTLGKIMTSTRTSDRSLEVVDEDLLESLPGVDGVAAEALQLGERRRIQSHRKVDDFGDVRAPATSHYRKTGHFRRPEADENRPNANENSRFRRLPDENRPTK
jgi:hypothetical protein